MGQKGGLLVGIILVTLLILPLLVVLNFGYLKSLGDGFNTSNPQENNVPTGISGLLGQAKQTQTQANLKAISTSLEAYYTEFGSYPNSLSEANGHAGSTNTTNIVYLKCSSSTAIIYYNSENYPGYILSGTSLKSISGQVPSC